MPAIAPVEVGMEIPLVRFHKLKSKVMNMPTSVH